MAHIHEKIDLTVSVFVVFRGRVLIRKHDKYGIWLGVGGHIELNEDPNQAAVRETREEVGLDIILWDGEQKIHSTHHAGHKELIPPVGLNRHQVEQGHEHVDLIYFARSSSDEVTPENSDDEWHWCAKKDLEKLELQPDVLFYAQLALDTLS